MSTRRGSGTGSAAGARRRALLVPVVLLAVAGCVAAVSIGGLYQVALVGERARLTDLAEYQASLWQGLARSHLAQAPDEHADTLFAHFLAEIQAANSEYGLTGGTSEITVAERHGDDIVFILTLADPSLTPESAVPFGGPRAEPQRRALSGERGTMVALDYRGQEVLAAYLPAEVMDHQMGIVAKIDMAEVRAPYVRMGVVVAGVSVMLILLGMLLIRWLGSPILRQLEESERKYRGFFEGAVDAIAVTTPEGRILEGNRASLELFGYTPDEFSEINAEDLYAHPEDRRHYREKLEAQGTVRNMEVTLLTKQGKPIPCLLSTRVVRGHALGETVFEVIARDISALRKAETMYRRLHDHMLDGFALHSMVWAEDGTAADYVFLAVNPAFEPLTGLVAEDVLGMRATEAVPGLESSWIETYGEVVRSGEARTFQSYSGPLGRHFEVQAFRTEANEFATIFRDVTERVNATKELALSRTRLRRLARHSESVREEERRTLSRELHDGVGQALTAMHIDLSLLRDEVEEPHLAEELDRLIEATEQHITLTQSLSARLRPPVLDHLGLAAAIRWEADRTVNRTELDILVDVPSEPLSLSTEAEVALFRIVQEALTNTIRHAGARTVWIDIHVLGEATVLRVRDDGRGFKEGDATGMESLGLLGMRERTLAIGGTLELTNGPEGGACVTVSVPHVDAVGAVADPA